MRIAAASADKTDLPVGPVAEWFRRRTAAPTKAYIAILVDAAIGTRDFHRPRTYQRTVQLRRDHAGTRFDRFGAGKAEILAKARTDDLHAHRHAIRQARRHGHRWKPENWHRHHRRALAPQRRGAGRAFDVEAVLVDGLRRYR